MTETDEYHRSYLVNALEIGTIISKILCLQHPDQNLYVVVRKTYFCEMQSELQLKCQEIEELSTRQGFIKNKTVKY